MKLLALHIERLPGLRDGLKLEREHLDGAVRVLHGPNAIGKSSLVRALKALLWWREASPREYLVIEGVFEIEGAQWRARRDGPETRWTRDGAEALPPRLPAWEHATQLLIGLDDLTIEGADGFAAHVQREFGGGYDLGAVERDLRPNAQAGRAQSQALARAEVALREARTAQEGILRKDADLEDLRRELAAAKAASARERALEDARRLAVARAGLAAAQAELAGFPAGIDALRGSEADDLESLRQRLASEHQNAAAARNEDARLARELVKLGLEQPIAPALLEELDARIEELRNAEAALRTARDAQSASESRVRAAEQAFGPGATRADLEQVAALAPETASEIESCARALESAERRRAELQAQLSALADAAAVQPPEPRALAALEDWLATPRAPAQDRRLRTALVALAVLLVTLGAGLAFVHVAFLGLILVGAAAFVAARSTSAPAGPSRADHQASFQQAAEAPPAAWTDEAVRRRLAELRRQDAEAEKARLLVEQRSQLASRLDAAEKEVRAGEERRAVLANRFGPALLAPAGAVAAFLKACEELRDARGGLAAAAAALARRVRDREEALAGFNAVLRKLEVPAVGDLAAARASASDLRSRSASCAELLGKRDVQSELARRAEEAARDHEERITALFHRAGVDPEDEAELGRRLERVGEWKAARARRDAAERLVEGLRPRVAPDLAEATTERIDAELQAANALASDAEGIAARVTEIETGLKLAQQGRALETALECRDACLEALRSAYDTTTRLEIASALLADVRKAHEATSRPRIVEEAERLFTRFTHGRYALVATLSAGRLHLAARDAKDSGQPIALDALSDGTRAQLLLAARLAYLARIEQETTREPLPVVLDDALATSDPARTIEIGSALLDVARKEGRQFLVLTTDAADAGLLRPAGSAPGDVEVTDLEAVRATGLPVAARDRAVAPEPTVVADLGLLDEAQRVDALAAAGMPVREPDPYRPVDDAHVWWVLSHDPVLLQRLLEHRFDTVGAFRNAARAGLGGIGAGDLAAAAPWVALAEGVLDAWRVGRGRPLTAEIVSEMVSDRYRTGLIALAKELRGDARAWLAALERRDEERTKGYHANKIKEHRERLAAEGLLDSREPLSREEAWVRVLGAVPEGHGIPAPELRSRFEVLWRACSGGPWVHVTRA